MPHDPKHQMLHASPNVQTVWQVYAAFQSGDLPTVLEVFSPEVELIQSEALPWGGCYHGHQGAKDFVENLTKHIDSRVMLERFVDAGDTVIAIGRTQGTVRANNESFDAPIAHSWTLSGGQVTRAHYCIDHPTMLKALNPPEPEEQVEETVPA